MKHFFNTIKSWFKKSSKSSQATVGDEALNYPVEPTVIYYPDGKAKQLPLSAIEYYPNGSYKIY